MTPASADAPFHAAEMASLSLVVAEASGGQAAGSRARHRLDVHIATNGTTRALSSATGLIACRSRSVATPSILRQKVCLGFDQSRARCARPTDRRGRAIQRTLGSSQRRLVGRRSTRRGVPC